MSSTTTTTTPSSSYLWMPERDLLNMDPSLLCNNKNNNNSPVQEQQLFSWHNCLPRLAKDEMYAKTIQTAWNQNNDYISSSKKVPLLESVGRPMPYHLDDDNGTILFGHVIRPKQQQTTTKTTNDNNTSTHHRLPGILLFHTGAGPRDLFLHWKANILATDTTLHSGGDGAIVFIVDLLGDENGWAWSADKTQYNKLRHSILSYHDNDDGSRVRMELRRRIHAAYNALLSIQYTDNDDDDTGAIMVDKDKIVALGWCFGGHSIFELACMQLRGIRALVSFHGVFGDILSPSSSTTTTTTKKEEEEEEETTTLSRQQQQPPPKVLICNGSKDPFVSKDDLMNVYQILESRSDHHHHHHHNNNNDDNDDNVFVKILSLDGARHGFTNPAQKYNPNPNFEFNALAAEKSWDAAMELLQKVLK